MKFMENGEGSYFYSLMNIIVNKRKYSINGHYNCYGKRNYKDLLFEFSGF